MDIPIFLAHGRVFFYYSYEFFVSAGTDGSVGYQVNKLDITCCAPFISALQAAAETYLRYSFPKLFYILPRQRYQLRILVKCERYF
ncbi:hypothetical protein BSC09_25210 [Salmonella enterica]|nr:hypothetical protein [Salmonella enterica]EBH4485641.1 hypothetical protein [Salmonella enterica]EBO3633827.1 hypothetical protein [Salmonella enterica]